MKKYNRKQLIQMVAEKTGYYDFNVAEIYTALENIICELLLDADENDDVTIRPFHGLVLTSTFVPAHDKRMPDGSSCYVEDSLKFSARYSKFWKTSRNTIYKDTRRIWNRITERKKDK